MSVCPVWNVLSKTECQRLTSPLLTSTKLINARPVIGVIKEFFMSSQLSQFMDQTNPLAELEHKRRLSAMGPGGLTRERAGFDVRDVHATHYGRICPIATPEGPNIGLVGHLSTYAKLNSYGFLETPYRKVAHEKTGSRVTDEIVYIDAFEEEKFTTADSTIPTDENGKILVHKFEVRKHGQPSVEDAGKIDFVGVAANQIISVATSLIPFMEHNDGQRSLMGTNMQRQAVPLITSESPVVGTGMEARAAFDSGHVVISTEEGLVTRADGLEIDVQNKKGGVIKYPLNKFLRSNSSTCINQHPIVCVGDKVHVNQIMSDGPAIDNGELSLGRNVLVAFMTWEGFNYEDAVIISERLVREDVFSSIHIENYTIDVRDTKLGPEVITQRHSKYQRRKIKES